MVTVEQYVDQFDRNFDEMKDEAYMEAPRDWNTFLKEETTNRAFVKKGYLGAMGLPTPNRDAQRIPLDEPPVGPVSFFQPVTYRLGYQIDRQTIEDEQYGLLATRPMQMVYGSQIIMDMSAADLLNNGTVLQSYDFGGTALFSAAQVREDNATTWSNYNNVDQPITVETVFAAIVDYLYNLKDSRGNPIAYQGTINIYVPTISQSLWRQAIEVANSLNNPNTSDNRVNALKASQFSFNVVGLRYLTDPETWFIGWQPSAPSYGLTMVIRSQPDITPLKNFNDNPDAWFSRLRMRYVVGYSNKRGIARIGA